MEGRRTRTGGGPAARPPRWHGAVLPVAAVEGSLRGTRGGGTGAGGGPAVLGDRERVTGLRRGHDGVAGGRARDGRVGDATVVHRRIAEVTLGVVLGRRVARLHLGDHVAGVGLGG